VNFSTLAFLLIGFALSSGFAPSAEKEPQKYLVGKKYKIQDKND